MIFDINTSVPLTWYAGSDVGSATLVVTDPAGAVHTLSPVTTGAPAGTYASSYTPTAAGRHTVTWTTGTRVFNDVFDVRPATFRALIGVQDAKQHLRLTDNRQVVDDVLQGFIEAASIAIENITGPMVPQQFIEYYDGGTDAIQVDWHPVMQGTVSIVEYYGTTAFTLTEQPLGGQSNAYGFTVDYATGQVRRRTFGGGAALFALGAKNIAITYKAGRATIPHNVILATKELVRHLWSSTQVPGRPKQSALGDDGFGAVPIGFAMPNFVVQLLQNDERNMGVA